MVDWERARDIGNDLDSQAFAAPLADMDGFELAALDTLQDGLS
jgi:hypothetical protein